jgi:biotin carboxyl carrier protein
MSEKLKVSGRTLVLPDAPAGWTFTERPGGWVIAHSPEGQRTRFLLHEAQDKLAFTQTGGSALSFQGEVVQAQRAGAAGGSDVDLVAQFPGKVRKVLVAEGAAVKQGEPLVLVEAMKMEFAIQAPADGIVKKLLVKEGQQLAPGDRFLDFHAGAPK